jgi:hypothetical protein
MSDSVNRIVPPSGTMERAGAITRERDGKNRQDRRRETVDKPKPELTPETQENGERLESETEKSKGINIDIKA